jgi:hypothetical protein
MNPVGADTAGVDAISGNILCNGMGRIAHQLIVSQVALSRAFGQLLSRSFRIDGSKHFKQRIVPSHLRPGLAVYGTGVGARSCVGLETKRLGLKISISNSWRRPRADPPAALITWVFSVIYHHCTPRSFRNGAGIRCRICIDLHASRSRNVCEPRQRRPSRPANTEERSMAVTHVINGLHSQPIAPLGRKMGYVS